MVDSGYLLQVEPTGLPLGLDLRFTGSRSQGLLVGPVEQRSCH